MLEAALIFHVRLVCELTSDEQECVEERVATFNRSWDRELSLIVHDCHTYSRALIQAIKLG